MSSTRPRGRPPARSHRYHGGVSQAERSLSEESLELDADERAWLEERLREYRELLDYLQDH